MDFIKLLTKEQLPSLKEFIRQEYHPKYILLNDEFFNWQFKNNPFNPYPEYAMKVIELDGKIMATIGINPTPFKVMDDSLIAGNFMNLMSDEKLRGFGLGAQLIKVSNDDFKVAYNTGYNLKTRIIYEKLGNWTHMGTLRRFIKIFNVPKVEKLLNKKLPANENNDQYSDNDFFRIKSFDEYINAFWDEVKHKYPITINRSQKFLNWRYSNHPMLDYQIFLYKVNSQIKGYVIFRIEECDANGMHYKIGRIIDFICHDQYEKSMLQAVMAQIIKQNADFMDFLFTGNFHVSTLLTQGFVEDTEEPYKHIPILFNPINWERRDITWIVYFKDYGNNKSKYLDPNNWYITKGDSDQDRPNIPPDPK